MKKVIVDTSAPQSLESLDESKVFTALKLRTVEITNIITVVVGAG